MADEPNGAPAPDAELPTPVTIDNTGPLSVSGAAAALRKFRDGQDRPETKDTSTQRAPDGKFAKVETESAPVTEKDASPETVPGDDQQADPAELPSVEPPRSWSKEDKELFNSLPRETQERLAERERSRESDFLQRQNETAEKTKALTAKEQAAEQARQQYEALIPQLRQRIEVQMLSDFPDIKSHADIQKLATEDPFRFAQFQAAYMQLVAVAEEQKQTEQRRKEEDVQKNKVWATQQDETFNKKFPEFADPERAKEAHSKIANYLTKALGVDPDTIPELLDKGMLRDAQMRRVVYDAAKFFSAQQKATAVAAAPKPAPQRPGVAPNKGDSQRATVEALTQRLTNAKGMDATRTAFELYRAQKQARSS